MASEVQYGRRRGTSKRASSAEEACRMIQLPDLRQARVLNKAEWLWIQDKVKQVDRDKQSVIEAARRRENLHLQSQEVVKLWPNTIAGQRKKKLEAKKIRDEIEEEKRKLIDKEEATFQEQKRREAIEKAKTQLYYQTNHVKGLHRALLLTEVLKEREAQTELKQRIKSASQQVDKEFLDMVNTKMDEALKHEKEKALQRKLERQAIAEDQKNQIREKELVKEEEKMEKQKDGEEIHHHTELYQLEQRMEAERQAKQKRNLLQSHLEQLSNRDLIRAADVQKQEAEEEQRKCFLSAKQKMTKLRKEREIELFREAQMCREKIFNKLTVTQQEKTDTEEQRIAKAVAEQEAKQAQQEWEKDFRRATMLKQITAHRELKIREKELRDQTEKQNTRDTLQAIKEADRTFSEKQQLKAQKMKEDRRKLQDANATQMAEKSARHQQLKREEREFEERNAELLAEEEIQFQQYSQQVINAALEAQRNVFPLCKAVGEGIRGSSGPGFGGVVSSYLVQDRTGAQLPRYGSVITESIKMINKDVDIQDSKTRLGLTWF